MSGADSLQVHASGTICNPWVSVEGASRIMHQTQVLMSTALSLKLLNGAVHDLLIGAERSGCVLQRLPPTSTSRSALCLSWSQRASWSWSTS